MVRWRQKNKINKNNKSSAGTKRMWLRTGTHSFRHGFQKKTEFCPHTAPLCTPPPPPRPPLAPPLFTPLPVVTAELEPSLTRWMCFHSRPSRLPVERTDTMFRWRLRGFTRVPTHKSFFVWQLLLLLRRRSSSSEAEGCCWWRLFRGASFSCGASFLLLFFFFLTSRRSVEKRKNASDTIVWKQEKCWKYFGQQGLDF